MSRCGKPGAGAAGRTPKGGEYRPRNPRASPLYQCADRHMAELRSEGRLQRLLEERVIDRFLKCGDPQHGFARIYCPECRHDYLLAFSCYAQRETIWSSPLRTGYFLESSQGFTPDSFSL